jgi:hypothetical protein
MVATRYTLRLCRGPSKCYFPEMTSAEEIEKAVEQLAPRELARFRAWFEVFDAAQFDAAIERDISAGKLDAHAMKPFPRTAPGARATCEAGRRLRLRETRLFSSQPRPIMVHYQS